MKLFSQRKGLKPVRTALQKDDIDDALRNGIWNTLTDCYWSIITQEANPYTNHPTRYDQIFIGKIWADYFKLPVDILSSKWGKIYDALRAHYFKCQWNEIYDFTEFMANTYHSDSINSKFMNACNSILEREMSSCRFVGGRITELTSEQEIVAIEEALDIPESLKPVQLHLENALGKLSDRKSPDYRNSIKESISAVESLCNLLKGNKSTLPDTLKEFTHLHPALKDSFTKLYGYTSDAHGIRHALMDEPNLKFEDAKFMLVACSAFTNFLVAKASQEGLRIKSR